jgi:hypothetical protein
MVEGFSIVCCSMIVSFGLVPIAATLAALPLPRQAQAGA